MRTGTKNIRSSVNELGRFMGLATQVSRPSGCGHAAPHYRLRVCVTSTPADRGSRGEMDDDFALFWASSSMREEPIRVQHACCKPVQNANAKKHLEAIYDVSKMFRLFCNNLCVLKYLRRVLH